MQLQAFIVQMLLEIAHFFSETHSTLGGSVSHSNSRIRRRQMEKDRIRVGSSCYEICLKNKILI